VAGRHLVDRCVIEEAVVLGIERAVGHAVRQDFSPAPDARRSAVLPSVDEILHPFAPDRRAVDVKLALDHLNALAR
jgi:hypothetical protein